MELAARLQVLVGLLFHALLQRRFLGDVLFGGALADVIGDSHRATMRAFCRAGHDKSGSAFGAERGMEKLNPELVRLIGERQIGGEPAARPDGVFHPLLVHGIDVERRTRLTSAKRSKLMPQDRTGVLLGLGARVGSTRIMSFADAPDRMPRRAFRNSAIPQFQMLQII